MLDSFIPPKNTDDLTPLLSKAIQDKRVCIFIDAANLYHAAHKAQLRIDYFHLVKWFQSHCKLNGVNFYTAYDPEDKRQIKFFEDLERAGYRVIKKPIRIFTDQRIKGNMDIELAVDIMLQKDTYDILVLFSGDGDFSYLIRVLDHMEKETVLLGIGGFTSYELHQEVDHYFFMNRIKSVWLKPGRPRNIPIIIPDALAQAKTLAEEKIKRLRPRRTDSQSQNNTNQTSSDIRELPINREIPKVRRARIPNRTNQTSETKKPISTSSLTTREPSKSDLHSKKNQTHLPNTRSKIPSNTKNENNTKAEMKNEKINNNDRTKTIHTTKVSPKVRVRVNSNTPKATPNIPQILVD